MSVNEPMDERKDSQDPGDKLPPTRISDWADFKYSTVRARRGYVTALLVIFLIAFTLFLKVAPFPSDIRNDVILSWQFVSIVIMTFILALYKVWTGDYVSDSISFVELDERNRYEKSKVTAATIHQESQRTAFLKALELAELNSEVSKGLVRPGKVVSGYDFVEHMRSIIESLDKQIDYAEEKASRLLEAGRNFVRGGIWLYVSNIVIWQAYLYYINFNINAGVVVGMASSTVIFLIMEFLGAWYLKQYRHYGDSAFSYMKVRSSYNRAMLAYCTIVQFGNDDAAKSKDDMLKVLAQSEGWPDIKEMHSNDFNYMLQSVESMGAVFEKLKGVFARTNTSGGAS